MTYQPLDIAIEHYYWKPYAALFRSIEMRMYCGLHLVIPGPLLDLGCGDGQVAHMLTRLGVIEGFLCGIDISFTELAKAQKAKAHRYLIQADANYLPFKDGTFESAISNGVLYSIPEGVEQPLREVKRVLKQQGSFVATVPTDQFFDVLLWPKMFHWLSPQLAAAYVSKFSVRLACFSMYSVDNWKDRFDRSDLSVINHQPFFSTQAGVLWNVLTIHPFRGFGLLKLLRIPFFNVFVQNIWKILFRRVYLKEKVRQTRYGYLLLCSQKVNS